jgi:hypothetical protein
MRNRVYEGFTSQWKKALFLTCQGPIEKVYTSLDTLSKDVVHFYHLHIQSGGSATMSSPRVQTQQPSMQQQRQYTSSHPNYRTQPSAPVGSKRPHGTHTSAMSPASSDRTTLQQFDNLPSYFCKGGSDFKMGRSRNFVCCLCLTFGHTYEYCETHNGFKPGGQPVRSDPRTNTNGGGPLLLTNSTTPK